ncbi:MAG: hypothetical protein E7388_05300 [Ruminococcaceae bacterium]|nr:hypothetical protein [Oscillospiraceae bacterium]
MNREVAINAIRDFNYFIDTKMEERITSGELLSDTMADIQEFAKTIEPDWTEQHKEVLEEVKQASDEEFLDLCSYVMLNNTGAIPTFIEEGLKERGKASEEFLTGYLESDILQVDVNSSSLTKEQLYDTDMVNSAIYLAGKMESSAMYEKLTALFLNCLSANEMFLEKMVTALSSEKAIEYITKLLEDESLNSSKRADAMQMVCNSGVRNDDLFKLMKKNFKALSKDPATEIVAAMLMFDYGDPRIIPALRKLVIDKIEATSGIIKSDNTPIYILLSMIHKMGGTTQDLTGGKDIFN